MNFLSKNRLIRILKYSAALGLILQGAGCTTIDPVTGASTYNAYSLDQEVKLGQSFLQKNTEQMREANVRVDDDPKRVAQLQEMVNRLSAVSDLPQLPYSVRLYHTNIVNAAAAPGGSMMVFEGLYDPEEGLVDPNDEDELAAVMAHEIAHVNCRHVTERLSKVQTAQALATVGALVALADDKEDVAAIIQSVFVVGAALIIPSYTRGSEAEADRVGIFYMAKAGYDPRAAPRIWRKAYEKSGDSGNSMLSIFKTHPADKKRSESLMKLLPYAMEEYARVHGSFPRGYRHPAGLQLDPNFNWRTAE